ncbi:MAG: choice-of-anchor D domain-containing protein, partial [Terriglobia bacterium]
AYQGTVGGVAGNAFVAEIAPANDPAVGLAPAKVNFGNETVSVRSSAQTVTLINAGTAALNITAISVSGTNFAETDNCVGTVAANGGTCTLNVTFTPAAVGAETEEISLTDNAAESPQKITLTGTGVTQATSVNVAPTSLTFSNQAVGSVSAPQVVTVSNSGSATLNITGIAVSGDFTQTNTCGAVGDVLNSGQSCSISVFFSPTASGSRTGGLSISDNATGSPQTVSLTGTGTALFSISSPNPVVTALIGSTSTTYTVSASAASGFTGSITLSCSSGATCSFSPASIFGGQTSTLTLSGLSASTANPYNFTVAGTSGTQASTTQLRAQLETFTLTAPTPLNTIVPGASARYTLVVTPSFGFNKAVNLSCTAGLPAGATCSFSPATVTPNGSSPSSVTLTVITTQTSSLWPFWSGHTRPPGWWLILGVLWLIFTLTLLIRHKRRGGVLASRIAIFGVLLLLAVTLASCRSVSTTSPTPTGNYIIVITGTLSSNSAVTVITTVDLSVT